MVMIHIPNISGCVLKFDSLKVSVKFYRLILSSKIMMRRRKRRYL